MSSLIIDELAGSGTTQVTDKGITGTRIARCYWQNWPAVVLDLMGIPLFFNGSMQIIGRQSWPDIPLLQVDTVQVEGMGRMRKTNWWQGPGYTYAKVTIGYKVPENEDDKDENGNPATYLIESLDYAVEVAVVPVLVVDDVDKTKANKTAADLKNEPLSNPDGSPRFPKPIPPDKAKPVKRTVKRHIRIPSVTYKVTIPKLSKLPSDRITKAVGRVNERPIFGGEPGTVLFDGPNAERESALFTQRYWRLSYQFIYQPFGWNNTLHPESLKWVPAKGAGSDNDPYEYYILQDLFPPPYTVRGGTGE